MSSDEEFLNESLSHRSSIDNSTVRNQRISQWKIIGIISIVIILLVAIFFGIFKLIQKPHSPSSPTSISLTTYNSNDASKKLSHCSINPSLYLINTRLFSLEKSGGLDWTQLLVPI